MILFLFQKQIKRLIGCTFYFDRFKIIFYLNSKQNRSQVNLKPGDYVEIAERHGSGWAYGKVDKKYKFKRRQIISKIIFFQLSDFIKFIKNNKFIICIKVKSQPQGPIVVEGWFPDWMCDAKFCTPV